MKIVKKILSAIPIIIFLLSLFIIVTVSISIKNRKVPSIVGYSYMTVLTKSMEPDIMMNDFIVVKNTKEVFIGDVISFYYDINNDGLMEVNTHKIIDIVDDVYITHGVNNEEGNNEEVSKEDIVGKVVYKSNFLGKIFSLSFINNKNLIFLGIVIFLIIFIIYQVINIFKMIKNKEEWHEEKHTWYASIWRIIN